MKIVTFQKLIAKLDDFEGCEFDMELDSGDGLLLNIGNNLGVDLFYAKQGSAVVCERDYICKFTVQDLIKLKSQIDELLNMKVDFIND